ncbi:MAG: hypothetical protein ABJ275_07580 [Maricaulaceae bacterium]
MKNISRLEIIFIAISCLIVLAFIKMNVFDDKTDPHDIIKPHNESHELERDSYSTQNIDTQKPNQKKPKEISEISNDLICDNYCQDDISKSLVTSGLLTTDMIARIRENPIEFAKQLAMTPEILSRLLATLKADEEKDNGTQNAALAILNALPDQDKLALAKILTSHERDQERIVGLELLELSLETQTGSIQTLNKILENEGDLAVLSKAINIASNLPKETELQDTLNALTNLIRYNSSDHVSGIALLAKVNIVPSASIAYKDISDSLASISSDKNAFGLTALETALQRGNAKFALEESWYDDLSLRESVRAMVQNQDLSEDTRAEANHLLNSYFSDD